MPSRIYFDHSATTPLDPKVLEVQVVAAGVGEDAVRARFPQARISAADARVTLHLGGEGDTGEVLRGLLDLGARVESVTSRKESLEDLFVREAKA